MPNQHLQICMGGPQIWLETADMLEDNTLILHISTNWVAQWCLNVIMCLEFIPDALPEGGFAALM